MDYSFTEEQNELRSMLRSLTAKHATSEKLRAAVDGDGAPGWDEELWGRLVELGLPALVVPENLDGMGASFVEVCVVLEELGAVLAAVPFMPTIVAAQTLASCPASDMRDDVLRRIAGGEPATLIVPRMWAETGSISEGAGLAVDPSGGLSGSGHYTINGQIATIFVVCAEGPQGPGLYIVDAEGDGVEVHASEPMDLTRQIATIDFTAAPAALVSAEDHGDQVVSDALDVMRAALAVESVGAAQRCLDITVEYLNGREQFGQVIAKFQALKHRCADQVVVIEASRTAAYHAAWCVSNDIDELRIQGPLAKAVAAQALRVVSGESIQLHGGVGFTWEYDPHMYFKRAKSNELMFGNDSQNRRLVQTRAEL